MMAMRQRRQRRSSSHLTAHRLATAPAQLTLLLCLCSADGYMYCAIAAPSTHLLDTRSRTSKQQPAP
jgi:hypothetical protein